MNLPRGAWTLVKEVARHLLRRPVVGVAVFARTEDGRVLLVRRADTGLWVLPGGTLEWGETLRNCVVRELFEEAGVEQVSLGRLLGVVSDPARDPRFHAVTLVVSARVVAPGRPPLNPLEIREARLFEESELPSPLSHGMSDVLARALRDETFWE